MRVWMSILALSIFVAGGAVAFEGPTAGMGKTLFESSALGQTDRSCATCHTGGKGLERIGDFDDAMLKDIVNACIRDALKGDPIDTESTEMNALILYLRSLP